MKTVSVSKDTDREAIGTSEGVILDFDMVILHKTLDHATVYNMFVKVYPDLVLVPITAGSHLYTLYGANTSYVKFI